MTRPPNAPGSADHADAADGLDRVERLLRDTLHAHVATIDPSPAPPVSALDAPPRRTVQQRRHPLALVAAAVLLVVAVGGVWWATTGRPDAGPVVDGPVRGTWSVPAASPLVPSQFREVMWTGSEFLVWGGVIGNSGLGDGASYDPSTDTWRPMAPPPAGVRPGSAVWTGDRMVTASGRAAFAYDPATGSWSPLGTFEEPPDTAFVAGAGDVTDVVRSAEHVFAIGVLRDSTGDGATLSAWLLDGDVWRWADTVPIDAGIPAIRSSTTLPVQMSVHDPVPLQDGFALWDGQRDGWRFSIDGGWQPLPTVEEYDDSGALVSEGRLVSVDGELWVVALGKSAETDDLRIARLTGDRWSEWTVVSDRAVLGLRVLAAGDRIVAFGADMAADPATPGVPRLIDPTTGTSTSLDGYPIDTVIDRGAAWSGSQLLVVGGQNSTTDGVAATGGVILDTVSTSVALWTAARPDTTTAEATTTDTSPPTTAPPTTAPPTTEDVTGAVDGPVLRYPRPATDTGGMAAEVRGRLELEGTCLYVALDEVGERYPVLWPGGTRWDPVALAVVPPSGAPMPVGASVYGGGGYLYVDDLERLAGPDAARLAAACVDNTYGDIAVVNNAPGAIALDPG